MMFWRPVQLMFLVLCVSTRPEGLAFLQVPEENTRTLEVEVSRGQPSYMLRISAKGREGVVDVRDGSKALIQILTCPLLQGVPNPSDLEIKGAAEQFVMHFGTEDLNLDGHMDLKGPREFGASWVRYCVWLFDPRSRTFQKDFLAEQLELLYNLIADPKLGRVVAYSIGPVNPLRDEYRIENIGKDRPHWPLLVPVRSCSIETGPTGENPTAVLTRYEHGRSVVTRHPLPSDTGLGKRVKSFCD